MKGIWLTYEMARHEHYFRSFATSVERQDEMSNVLCGGAFVIVTRPDGTHEYEEYDSDGGVLHARECWDPFYGAAIDGTTFPSCFAVMCRADMPGAAVDYTRPPMISQLQPLACTAASVAFYTEF